MAGLVPFPPTHGAAKLPTTRSRLEHARQLVSYYPGCCRAPHSRSRAVCLAEQQTRSNPKPASLDVVALGNLCVDAFVPVETLPPADIEYRKKLLKDLCRQPPTQTRWEVGGNCNFIIAAARIGMAVGTVGHYGRDDYGTFLRDVLKTEGTMHVMNVAQNAPGTISDETLVCFVLVDPNSRHTFCSTYDFGPWPLLSGISSLPESCLQVLSNTKAVFTNGFIFDELPVELITSAVQHATKAGACSVFDPGPRCATMKESPDPSRRLALDRMLDLSEVVLMTEDEAEIVTGLRDPVHAASWVLARPGSRAQWAVVKLGSQGALVATRQDPKSFHLSPAFQVQVADTVGCGDSLASAVVLGYTRGVDPATTLALANAVGAATAMGHGAGRNVAATATVQRLLQQHSHMQNVPEASRLLEASLKQARGRLATPAIPLAACEV